MMKKRLQKRNPRRWTITKTKEHRERLAEEFIHILEEKWLDWKKEWNGFGAGVPRNGYSGYQYKGINRFYLNLIAMQRGYQDARWCTFKQIKDRGWCLKDAKGQGVKVEYWFPYDKEERRVLTWEEFRKLRAEIGERYLLRAGYKVVFNASLIEGIPELPKPEVKDISPAELIGTLSAGMEVKIINDGGDRAFYSPSDDTIHLPVPGCFDSEYAYNSTALHELAHSTGAPGRLNRALGGGFGTESYAFEELVAEISSCFMSAGLPVGQDEKHIENHKAYVQSWIRSIREKPDSLIRAIQQAERAAAYMDYKAGLTTKQEYEQVAASTQEIKDSVIAEPDSGKIAAHNEKTMENKMEGRKETRKKMADKIGKERFVARDLSDSGMEWQELKDSPVNIWIGNQRAYTLGQLKGEWVSLPMPDEELEAVMERISYMEDGIRGELAIMDMTFREDCHSYLERTVGEYTGIRELNIVARQIGFRRHPAVELYTSSDAYGLSQIANILMQEEDIQYSQYSFEGMENLTDISTEEKMGYTIVENDTELHRILKDRGISDYVDYASIGRDASFNGAVLGQEGYLEPRQQSIETDMYSMEEIKSWLAQETYAIYDVEKEEYVTIGHDIMIFQSYAEARGMAETLNENAARRKSAEGLSQTLCGLIERSGREGSYTVPAGEMPSATLKLLEAECGKERLGEYILFNIPGTDVEVRSGLSEKYDLSPGESIRKGARIEKGQKQEIIAAHRL